MIEALTGSVFIFLASLFVLAIVVCLVFGGGFKRDPEKWGPR